MPRGKLYDDAGRPYAWTGKVLRKIWNILYSIFQGHPAFENILTNQPMEF
jgi:hypothetical protein